MTSTLAFQVDAFQNDAFQTYDIDLDTAGKPVRVTYVHLVTRVGSVVCRTHTGLLSARAKVETTTVRTAVASRTFRKTAKRLRQE